LPAGPRHERRHAHGERDRGRRARGPHGDRRVMTWACPVCGGREYRALYPAPEAGTEGGVDPDAFRPSAERFGKALGDIVECRACGHGSLLEQPPAEAVATAYAAAEDPVSLREEQGQVRTADRALVEIERLVRPGRVCDVGCWTGSFLVAARARGWEPIGVEPSAWASARARDRGLDVRTAELDDHGQPPK